MWYKVNKDANYRFELQRGVLGSSPEVEQTVGGFLLDGLANAEHLRAILHRVGLSAAAKHFDAHVASKEHVRIGDFGEVVAGHLLEDEEKVVRLIEKLRHKESPDWPMKLTDVFAVTVENERIVGFLFGEAKAGTTTPNTTLGQEAYGRVQQDIEDEEPQILFFTLDRLLDTNAQESYLQLEDAMHRSPPVPRASRLIFVFDAKVWREEILETLQDDLDSGELGLEEDFKCYVLTREGLREVITGSYTEAGRMVPNG